MSAPLPFRLLALGAALAATSAIASDSLPGVRAAAGRPVLPVLIGVPYAPLVRVTIEVGKVGDSLWDRNDVHLTSLSFSLADTNLSDLQSVALVGTGDDERYKMDNWPNNPPGSRPGSVQTVVTPLGAPQAPAARVTFTLDRFLGGGKNVFWLTCRLRPTADLAHRIVADCVAVGTTAGQLTPADPSAGLRQRIGVAVRDRGWDGVDTYGIPVLATTAKGTLVAFYDMRWNYPGHDLQDHVTIGLSRSTSGGRTWEPMKTIMDMSRYGGLPPEQNGCGDPGTVVDRQTGEIFVFACWMHGNSRHHQWRVAGAAPGYQLGPSPQMLVVRSRDDGATWSEPQNLTRQLKKESWWLFVPAPTQGIQLEDGTLVMPMQGRDDTGAPFDTIMSSRDHGASWTVGSPASLACNECAVAELGDGSIMLNARNMAEDDTTHYRGVFVTRDLGRTWQAHGTNFNTLIEPTCNASLLRFDYDEGGARRHVLLFENPHYVENRSHDTLQVSFDDGCTWPRASYMLLDEGYGWSYPCLTRIDAGHVGILYAGSQAQIQFQVLSLDEILHRPAPLSQP